MDTNDSIDLPSQLLHYKNLHSTLVSKHKNLHFLELTSQLLTLHTIIRNKNTTSLDFIFYSDRLIRLLIEFCFEYIAYRDKSIVTPSGEVYNGCVKADYVCGISIVRSGEAMESAIRTVDNKIRLGKILLVSDKTEKPENNKDGILYCKVPKEIYKYKIFLMDAIMATGNGIKTAIDKLVTLDVLPKNIIIVNLICTPEGLDHVFKYYPDVQVCSSFCDQAVSTSGHYCLPGIGDFGERYFGTDNN